MRESAVPANAVTAHIKPIGPGDTPPGITAMQRRKKSRKHMEELARRARLKYK